jgi:hypothetical protein
MCALIKLSIRRYSAAIACPQCTCSCDLLYNCFKDNEGRRRFTVAECRPYQIPDSLVGPDPVGLQSLSDTVHVTVTQMGVCTGANQRYMGEISRTVSCTIIPLPGARSQRRGRGGLNESDRIDSINSRRVHIARYTHCITCENNKIRPAGHKC